MRYLVLGSSLRGLGDAARIAVAEGAEVMLFDAEHPGAPSDLEGSVTVLPPTWSPSMVDDVDRVITSPWFSEIVPPLADVLESGVEVVTEAGFGLEHLDVPVVAVTGTNGKTTVIETTTAMLRAAGVDAVAAGNIGSPISAIREGDASVLVCELSSYQLRFMPELRPTACALLNIAEDHLDWHGTFAAYVDAKARIFATAPSDAVLAFNIDDPIVSELARTAPCVTTPCSGVRVPEGGNGVSGDELVIDDVRYEAGHVDGTFRFNLVVAATLATRLGATTTAIGSVVSSFAPGAHRRERVAVVGGVAFINDSKATNPHAAVAAMQAFPSSIVLVGGRNKGLDLAPLVSAPAKALVAFGESGPAIASLATGVGRPTVAVARFDDAFTAAVAMARTGDTVLLSPGCASFDEFTSYEGRGQRFRELVEGLRGAA